MPQSIEQSVAPQFLRVHELADMWGVHKATILRRIDTGDIKAINVAPKGSPVKRWRIPASEADRPGMAVVQATPVKPTKKLKGRK